MSIDRGLDKDVTCAHTHTQTHMVEYYSAIKKNIIISFASNMDGPRNYQIK